jgi:hypothetical protein
VSDYGLDDRAIGVSIPGRGKIIFPLAPVQDRLWGTTQPRVQWVLGVLSPGLKRGRGVTLTSHPRLVLRLRMSRIYTSYPQAPTRRVVGQL